MWKYSEYLSRYFPSHTKVRSPQPGLFAFVCAILGITMLAALTRQVTQLISVALLILLGVLISALTNTGTPAYTDALTSGPYPVTHVVDGDTVDVLIGDTAARVRLLGVNTPETVDPRRPVECFGAEASAYLKEQLAYQSVYLESDPTQDDRDKYDRLLRYLYLPDHTVSVNEQLIRDGYAYEYTYDTPYRYQSHYRAAEIDARRNERGLWGAECETWPD